MTQLTHIHERWHVVVADTRGNVLWQTENTTEDTARGYYEAIQRRAVEFGQLRSLTLVCGEKAVDSCSFEENGK